MDKSRQRKYQKQINKSFIIHSKRVWWNELIVGLFTLLVWIYCLTVIALFVDAIFSLNNEYLFLFKIIFKMNNSDIKEFLFIGAIIFSIIYTSLIVWSVYNRRKYGKLKRRKYPTDTTREDMLNLNIIDEDIYELLQNNKVIVFEKNPIRISGEIYEKVS